MTSTIKHLTLFILLLLIEPAGVVAQKITGQVLDATTGESIPNAYVVYKDQNKGVQADIDGRFTIDRYTGWTLTVSCFGYKSEVIRVNRQTPNRLIVKLKEGASTMSEVEVVAKKKRYTRKNNPAVELMRRVIDARKRTQLENHDFYQYTRYQKLSVAVNDFNPAELDSTSRRKFDMRAHTEISPYNHKRIMPLLVDETVSQHVYRKEPRAEKDIIHGEHSSGINQLMLTGELVNTALKDVFQDVDIYEDNIRLLRLQFISPIGSGAINFYRYFLQDTVVVDGQKCYHLEFTPNNPPDIGFNGSLYILADSTLHVKRCSLGLPPQSGVNFVDNMHIDQIFTQLDNGEWVLTTDEMWAEMRLTKIKALAVRSTTLSDYAFDELPKNLFRGNAEVKRVGNARNRDEEFWSQYRAVELTEKEAGVSGFMAQLQQHKAAKIPLFLVKTVAENYIETSPIGKPSKFDIGPVMSTVSTNFVDGVRLRLSGRTNAALNPHWFWVGHAAYGFKSKQPYYGTTFTYSFNRKQHSPFEFPQREISFESAYDLMSPSDLFLINDKDNILMGIRTQKVQQMYTYNRQRLSFTWETDYGLNLKAALSTQKYHVAGDLHFHPLDCGPEVTSFRTTEFGVDVHFTPGQTYINTKQRRYPLNHDLPEYYVRHTVGFNGFIGGQFLSNQTDFGIYKRQWLGSFGHLDMRLDGSVQWNKLPFPLLITPPIGLTYIEQPGTFCLLSNMEIFMERKIYWSLSWEGGGKLFNRIPLIKKLKLREYVSFKGVWGYLTDKNNPTLPQNGGDADLYVLPQGSYPIDWHRPYMELAVGIRNILHFFSVEWVHRFNYYDQDNVKKNGVRFGLQVSF